MTELSSSFGKIFVTVTFLSKKLLKGCFDEKQFGKFFHART